MTKWVFLGAAVLGYAALIGAVRDASRRADLFEHNAVVLATLVAHCREGCLVWMNEAGELRAVPTADETDNQAPAMPPAAAPLIRF